MEGNLRQRQMLLEKAGPDRDVQRMLWDACSRDILYFVNLFCWTYDPRKPNPKIPFITYEFQDNALLCLSESLPHRTEDGSDFKGRDILIEKSRDMGASWMCLTLFFWGWLFRPMQSYLCLLYTSPSPRDLSTSRMPSSA